MDVNVVPLGRNGLDDALEGRPGCSEAEDGVDGKGPGVDGAG